MIAKLFPAVLLILSMAPLAARADATLEEVRARVPALIQQLGSEQYIERRSAQRDLRQIGLIAFDQLYAARENDDPEIATAATRLLGEMTVRWDQPGDSPIVRQLMEDFGRMSLRERDEMVVKLQLLEGAEGLGALCRIARFDLSPTVADSAAVAVLSPSNASDSYPPGAVTPLRMPGDYLAKAATVLAELEELYGPSERQSTRWIRWIAESKQGQGADDRLWRQEIDRLLALLKRNAGAVSPEVVEALAWQALRGELLRGDQGAAAATTAQLVEIDPQEALPVYRQALAWMAEAGADNAIDRVLADDEDNPLLASKRGLYLAAKTRLKQQRPQEADRLAELAFQQEPEPEETMGRRSGQPLLVGRVVVGWRLRQEDHPDWARRELGKVFHEEGPLSVAGAYAAWELADSFQDAARYQKAAEVLQGVLAVLDQDDQSRGAYRRMVDANDGLLQSRDKLAGSEAYFRSLAARNAGDARAEADALKQAIELYDDNADIIIAMYRAAPPDFPLREDALERADELAESFQRQIDQDPRESLYYNQWAWLISNTEGDYDKAVRYSRRALQLEPGDAGYLDTLGRCYYAVGDLENAVKAQREAVAKEPQFKVMQRQLELFESELAKRNEYPQE